MKKFLSALLCLNMVLSCVPTGAEETVSAKDTLEMFGFNPDPDSYDTNALKPGTHILEPKYDLYIDNGSKHSKTDAKLKYSIPSGLNFYPHFKLSTEISDAFTNQESSPYFVSTGFAATETGVDDHIAKVYLPYGKSGGNIRMSIYDAQGNAIVTGFETGGYIQTVETIEMWEVEGLLSVTSGDFDGDGIDEIAVYTPNNADRADGDIRSSISVGIFDVDVKNKKITTKQYLDLPSKTEGEQYCEWEYSQRYNNEKQFYCLPYVALSADDFNIDGTDDLAAIVNFSTWFRWHDGKQTYSTKEIIDHNTNFASVLEAYEGKKDGNLKQSIKHRVMVTTGMTGGSSDSSTQNRFILRNANLTTGDINGDGANEIIIAGNYTRAKVYGITSTTTATSNRYAEVDGEHALCHIVGYTTYENLKKREMYNSNSEYNWTVQRTGDGQTYWYNEDDTDSGPITVSLASFKRNGTGYPETIFVGGQFFEYNSESGTLAFLENSNITYPDSIGKTSVVWIGKAVAGNLANDVFGREAVVFPFYMKKSGKDIFSCEIDFFYNKTSLQSFGGKEVLANTYHYAFSNVSSQRLASLALLDGGGKTGYLTYDGNNTDVYYSDVEVLSIMQAPPLYEELNDDTYIGNSETSFTKSEGSSESWTQGGSLTAGVVTGFEYKASFLGIFPAVGAEYEFSLTGTVGGEDTQEKTYDYSSGFATSGTTDTAVIFAIPYVRYNCTMYVPEYTLPTEEDYNTLCAFRDELADNLRKYVDTGDTQSSGIYVKGCKYYYYRYSSYVTENNYMKQQEVLYKVAEEISFIEDAIASFGKGGTGEWGGTVQGAVLPYHYCIPQQPMVTTIDAKTYDTIADATPGLEKIYGNVFSETYRPGDPNTYAHLPSALNATGTVLQSKMSMGGSSDGYLTNSNSSAGSSQSQSISVEESDSDTLTWGAALENTSLAIVGGAKIGFTISAEYNGSHTTTTTHGNEYSGTVFSLPKDTPADYTYSWKLVSYTTMLNGKKVPVVGYLTKVNSTPPPSVAQNIDVEDITDTSATITWEQGNREASYYKLFRKYVVNGKEQEIEIASNIKSDENGKCSYSLSGLSPFSTLSYVIKSYDSNGKSSVVSERVTITTLPENFTTTLSADGIDSSVVYQKDAPVRIQSDITGNEGYETFYQWQIDKGNGWEKIDGWNSKNVSFNMSPLQNGYRIRCSAIVMLDTNSSYVVFSNPFTLRCAKECENFSVDWDSDRNKVTVTPAENAKNSDIMVAIYDNNKVLLDCIMGDYNNNVLDISPFADKGYTIRAFVWDENQAPLGYVFERKDDAKYTVDWDDVKGTVTVNVHESIKDDCNIIVAAYKDNVMKSCVMGDYEDNVFNISDYIKNDYKVKVYVWDDNQTPLGSAFER